MSPPVAAVQPDEFAWTPAAPVRHPVRLEEVSLGFATVTGLCSELDRLGTRSKSM